MEARSRGSGSSQASICQSLRPRAKAAPNSRFCCRPAPTRQFRRPYSISHSSSNCSRRKARSEPAGRPEGGQESCRAALGLARGYSQPSCPRSPDQAVMIPPALGKVLADRLVGGQSVVDVAVDDGGLGPAPSADHRSSLGFNGDGHGFLLKADRTHGRFQIRSGPAASREAGPGALPSGAPSWQCG